MELSYETWWKNLVAVHKTPHGQKAYIQQGVAWFPKRIINDTAATTPVP